MNISTFLGTITVILVLFQTNKIVVSQQSECIRDPVKVRFLPGGMNPIEIDANIEQQAFDASVMWNKQNRALTNSNHFIAITCIRNVKQKVVAGIIYEFNVTLRETECAREAIDTNDDLDECGLVETGLRLDCLIVYSMLIYENGTQITLTSNCTQANDTALTSPTMATISSTTISTKSPIQVGDVRTQATVTNQSDLIAFNASLIWNRQNSTSKYFFKVTRVVKFLSQVVAGLRYILDVNLTRTACRRDEVLRQASIELAPSDLDVCTPETSPRSSMPCHFELWLDARRNLNMTASQCKPADPLVLVDDDNEDSIDVDGSDVRHWVFKSSVEWNRVNNKDQQNIGFYKLTDIRAAKKTENEYLMNVSLTETACKRRDMLKKKKLFESDLQACNSKPNTTLDCVFKLDIVPAIRGNRKRAKFNSSSFVVKSCTKSPNSLSFRQTQSILTSNINSLPDGFKEIQLDYDVLNYVDLSAQIWNIDQGPTPNFFRVASVSKAGVKEEPSSRKVLNYYFNVTLVETKCKKASVFRKSIRSCLNKWTSNGLNRLRCEFLIRIDPSKPEESRVQLLSNKSCVQHYDQCNPNKVSATQETNGLYSLPIDVNLENVAFTAVRLWNEETPVWPTFLRLECLQAIQVNLTESTVDYFVNVTLIETDCKKSELVGGRLVYLDSSDLETCVDLINKYNCLLKLQFNPLSRLMSARIKMSYNQCVKSQ